MKRRRRKRKRNPGPALLLIGAAVVAAIGGVVLFFFDKKKQLVATNGQTFTQTTAPLQLGAFRDATGILAGDCILAKQGAAGFEVPGVPDGEQTPLRVVSSGGAGALAVQAVSLDPRASANVVLSVPVGAIAGSGDCAAGFA